MKINNQTITMNYTDFQKLIKEEVKKELKQQQSYIHPKDLFPSPRVAGEVVEEVNRKNDLVAEEIFKRLLVENSELYAHLGKKEVVERSRIDHQYREPVNRKRQFSNNDHIHNSIRSLSLGVFGQTLNKDLDLSDYPYAFDYYNRFLEVFIECYKDRLNREFPEK